MATIVFDGELSLNNTFDGEMGVFLKTGSEPHKTYAGPYEVTPMTESQVLETAQKLMRKNTAVYPVPYAEVINQSGGYTVTIGG